MNLDGVIARTGLLPLVRTVKTHSQNLAAAVLRVADSDLGLSFRSSPVSVASAIIFFFLVFGALLAPWIAPQNPLDLASLDLHNAELPPAWIDGGKIHFLLGTDNQGRDVLSAILYGLRVSLLIGFASVVLAMVIGVALGLTAGFLGGWVDVVIMRIADVELSFPTILIALLINGMIRIIFPEARSGSFALFVLVAAIGLSGWVQYARTTRGLTMVEKQKEYVQAARTIGQGSAFIAIRHILPNTFGPISVIATINFALAILTEATLSFLGVGLPPTSPSLGTLIRVGNEFMFSGLWWIVVFPSITLMILVLSENLLGDWLRDVFNPKLR
jgi:peptide/nickel transport system permease protein